MTYSSIDIIYNPNSTGPSDQYAEDLKSKLEDFGIQAKITLRATKYAGHAEQLAYKFAKSSENPLIISSSGDGGYNEVVNGAIRAQTEGAHPVCAVLAAGNANDHSRTVQNQELFDAITTGKPTSLDLLKITYKSRGHNEAHYAHSYIGLGLTPIVAVELNKTKLNALNELWIAVKTFYKFRPVRIKHKDKVITVDSIIFANIGEMAKVLTIAKNAKPDDGLFEVITFKKDRKLRLVRKLAKATLGGLEPSLQTNEYSFTALKKMPMQLDGEIKFVDKNSMVCVTSEKQILKTVV